MDEEWRDVVGYEDYYKVSNTGKILSKRTGKILKTQINPGNGYKMLVLSGEKEKKTVTVHRVVAKAFIDNPDNLGFINHKDENKMNNNASNLEWCTKAYNNTYGSKIERYYKPIIQIDIETGEETLWRSCIFPEKAGIASKKNISACCRGLRNKAGGYKWRYA